jgi:hypothetical protein
MKRNEALRKGQGYDGRTAERSLNTTQNTHHILMAATFSKGGKKGFKDKVDHPEDWTIS